MTLPDCLPDLLLLITDAGLSVTFARGGDTLDVTLATCGVPRYRLEQRVSRGELMFAACGPELVLVGVLQRMYVEWRGAVK